jgi:hypothetical protein
MTRHRVPNQILFSAVAVGVILACASVANAARNPCIKEAKQDFRECVAGCKETFQAGKDDCLDRDHACVEVCRAQRAECRDATGFDAAVRQCNDALETARAACPSGDGRDRCIDQAQVIAFQCRDAAREDAKPALKECRKTFKTCARTCNPNFPSNPEGARQCVKDAAAAGRTCNAGCKEAYQVDKDTCRNRDHACVEQCRVDRLGCVGPIRTQLDTDVAVCKTARDLEIANCELLFGEGTLERDTCIDNAQVDAFQCRDAAHEAARPGLAACRQTFRACADACPPPPAP